MKRIIVFAIALSIAIMSMAQNSGAGFNYQAVVRNADGILLANSNVSLRVSLYPGQMAASPTWIETHVVQTDMYGSFGITVGHGVRVAGSVAANYADINFAAVYYWMKIEILEGSNYREVSFAQLPSAPYCEVAHNAAAVPAGCIIPFAGSATNIPAGWMLCDGSEVSRSTYANLYNAIGVAWGTGNGSTTFNIPDMRGMFLRGWSGTDSINDPDRNLRTANCNGGNSGNNVGSFQGHGIPPIYGTFNGVESGGLVTTGAFGQTTNRGRGSNDSDWDNIILDFDASRVAPTGSDTRPNNVYVTYIIKY